MSRLIHSLQGYDLTNNPPSLPWSFLTSKTLTSLNLEFTRLTPLETAAGLENDVHLLLEYEPVDQHPSISLRMEYEPDPDAPAFSNGGFQEAYLCAKACFAAGPDILSTCTLKLDIAEGWTLAAVFDALLATNVQYFDFQKVFFQCHGQRDFMTQAIQIMHEANLLRSLSYTCIAGTDPCVSNVYAALGLRFTHRGITPCSIQKGRFTRGYDREYNPDVFYRLDQSALSLFNTSRYSAGVKYRLSVG